jgi:mono/diheme cytochrome c family protein
MKKILQMSSAPVLSTMAMLGVISLFISVNLAGSQTARAASKGQDLFALNCEGCHKAGANVMNPKKPIIGSAKLANKQTFKSFLLKPTGQMPPASAVTGNEADVSALYDYCKTLK